MSNYNLRTNIKQNPAKIKKVTISKKLKPALSAIRFEPRNQITGTLHTKLSFRDLRKLNYPKDDRGI
jgi:hypothetical protein